MVAGSSFFPWDDDMTGGGGMDAGVDVEEDGPLFWESLSAEQASEHFTNFLLDLNVRGILRANHVSMLAYFASRAGATGIV